MKDLEFKDLVNRNESELVAIKRKKIAKLGEVRNRKYILIGNILSLQALIKAEGMDNE